MWCFGVFQGGASFGQLLGASVTPEYQLSGEIRVDEADATTRARLVELEQAIAGGHWDEVVEALRELMVRAEGQLVNVTRSLPDVPPRYVPVREYCQLLLSKLPPEGLEKYRRIVDGVCQQWLQTGLERQDAALLRRLVETEFACSVADQALWYLGEWALQEGAPETAAFYWRQLLPIINKDSVLSTWRGVATSRYSPAAVRARVILSTIIGGQFEEAEENIKEYSVVHPQDQGRLGGREVVLAHALREILHQARTWKPKTNGSHWTTFAQTPSRHASVALPFDVTELLWRRSLPELPRSMVTLWSEPTVPPILEENTQPHAFFPVIINDSVFVTGVNEVYGLNLETGKPLWNEKDTRLFVLNEQNSNEPLIPVNTLGALRLTTSIDRGRLFARLGSLVTISPVLMSGTGKEKNFLVALDLTEEGKLLWLLEPPGENWAFEGPPLADSEDVFVIMRRSDVPSHVYLGCFEVESGTLKWMRFLCAGDSPGRSLLHEMTHLLPTVVGDMIFVNTNAGAISAVSRQDGAIRWISCYPRISRGDLTCWEPFRYREPNPCLYYQGEIFVAPTDSRFVMGIDAFSGTILWRTDERAENIQHLLGVIGDYLIGTGDRVYWIARRGPRTGQIVGQWPEGPERLGRGRGLIAGNYIYWPTKQAIYVLDGRTGQPVRVIPLSPWNIEGGNLAYVPGYLVMASARELVTFRAVPLSQVVQSEENVRR